MKVAKRLSVLLVVVAIVGGCNRWREVTRATTPQGEILSVRDQYTLIILSQDTMSQAFGPNWHQFNLFYGTNRAITQDGERAMVSSRPLRPLAKATPILVISGDRWPDLLVSVYALEPRQQAMFAIDTVKGSIRLLPKTESRLGEPIVAADGSLVFR
jgi:hypothetical protein